MGLQINRRDNWKAKLTNEVAERFFKEHEGDNNGMNVRQAFQNARGGTQKVVVPKIQRCEHKAPEEINVHSDGSLINTKTNSFKFAGAGV